MTAKQDLARTVRAKFEGPAVGTGRVAVPSLVRVLEGLQEALVLIAEDMWGREHTSGPVPSSIRDQVTLELSGIRRGSFAAKCELRPPPADRRERMFFEEVGEEALDRLMGGIRAEQRGDTYGLSDPVRSLIRGFVGHLDEGISKLTLSGGRSRVKVVITEPAHRHINRTARVAVAVTGSVLEVDYRDNSAEVWDDQGRVTRIGVPPALMDDIDRARRRKVTVSGDAEVDGRGRPRKFEVSRVRPASAAGGFWEGATTEALAADQGVSPVRDPRSLLADFWPEDDLSDFLEALASWRHEPSPTA